LGVGFGVQDVGLRVVFRTQDVRCRLGVRRAVYIVVSFKTRHVVSFKTRHVVYFKTRHVVSV
jgi:hypothetical protein